LSARAICSARTRLLGLSGVSKKPLDKFLGAKDLQWGKDREVPAKAIKKMVAMQEPEQ
jgi:hypothetical protein